jgi:ABC-type xylose transport system, permease component
LDYGKKIIMDNKDQKKDSLYLKLIPYFDRYGILLLLFIMIVVMHFLQPDVFLSWRNVTNVFKQIFLAIYARSRSFHGN